MRYVVERTNEYVRDMSYRIYVTDALKSIVENTKYHIGIDGIIEHGFSMSERWADSFYPKEIEPEDPQSCEEIATEVFKRAGLS